MGKTLVDRLLHDVYYNLRSPASYAGVHKVLAEAKRRHPNINMNDVQNFLSKQRTYTLFRARRKRFPRLRTIAAGLNTDWQCDLCIMDSLKAQNDGFRYILVCVDVLSRKIYTAEVESKKSDHMITAFEKIFHKAKALPNKMYSDSGVEFQAKRMLDFWKQKQIIKHIMYSPDIHAGIVERANRTIKERLYRYFSEKNTHRWVDVIDKIVKNLNQSVNRSTGVKPDDVTYKNAAALRKRLYKEGEIPKYKICFKVGDTVRIAKEKGTFEKGYYPNFTDEIFKISQVNRHSHPPSYRIVDLQGEEIKGIFYNQELVKTTDQAGSIAELLKTRIRKGIKEHFVKWIGPPNRNNSWIKDSELIKSSDG